MKVKPNDGRLRENSNMLNAVVRDHSDKVNTTFAVVIGNSLLPVRFANFDEAWTHLQRLEAA